MGLIDCIDQCKKLDTFDNLEVGDYVRYITPNIKTGEWVEHDGGYFKKHSINCNNIPYIVLYRFVSKRTIVINTRRQLENGQYIDNLLFYDPVVQRKIPPIPKYQALAMNNAGLDGSPEKDNTILVMNKKIEDLEVEVKYLKGKLKLYERENKVLRMAVKR